MRIFKLNMKVKEKFEDMLIKIDKINNLTNINNARFRMNLYYCQSDEIDDDLILKILF